MLNAKQIKAIEKADYSISEYDDTYYISRYSNLGEDFGFEVNKENALEEIISYCEDFDYEEHASMWIECRGQRGVPNSIVDLIDDAKDIYDNLQHLKECLEGVE